MRIVPCTLILVCYFMLTSGSLRAASSLPCFHDPPANNLNESIIRFRFQLMDCPVKPVYNADVASYLRRFLTYGHRDTEKMLGRSAMYFPIFEHYLEMHGLPDQLKFLPMIESSLVPYAVSTSGAAGLWQFMPSTGRYLGLIVDECLDERKDAYKSTEAAIKYLKRLYKRFGTWELALAAYNCGPTRLSRVIRSLNTNDFWELRDRLPRETQRYVSRYLAACYIGTYYTEHNLIPQYPEEYHVQPMAARVHEPVSLQKIARTTGVEISLLRKLNPSFQSDYSPARPSGIFLVLPKEAWYDYLDTRMRSKRLAAARP